MVYGANTLYSKISANRKSEAEQKLVVDMAQNKEQSSDESATDSL
jgi:hypothetical protein